jgi:hypothetical protein
MGDLCRGYSVKSTPQLLQSQQQCLGAAVAVVVLLRIVKERKEGRGSEYQ